GVGSWRYAQSSAHIGLKVDVLCDDLVDRIGTFFLLPPDEFIELRLHHGASWSRGIRDDDFVQVTLLDESGDNQERLKVAAPPAGGEAPPVGHPFRIEIGRHKFFAYWKNLVVARVNPHRAHCLCPLRCE